MGLFNDNSGNNTCPTPANFNTVAAEPIFDSWSFRTFNEILSGACAAFSTISILILMARHATHYSKPNEQSKILKICSLIPLYSILSWVTIAVPNSFIYLTPWLELFEAYSLGCFFLLLCEFVSPSTQFRDVFFAALEVPQSRKAKDQRQDGLEWYRKKWFAVFQYIIVSILVAILTAITQAANVYCLTSSKIHFAHIWCTIIINVSVVIAVLAVLRFYTALKKDLEHHKPLAKFIAFKLIIFLTFVQKIVFWILRSTNSLKETSKLTFADVNFGIETMIVCIELVPFSIFFHYAYDVAAYDLTKARPLPLSDIASTNSSTGSVEEGGYTGYQSQSGLGQPMKQQQSRFGNDTGAYYGGFLGFRAWLSLLDPRETLRAISFAFVMRSEAGKMDRDVLQMGPPPPTYYASQRQ